MLVVEELGDDEIEDGVAKELHALVRCAGMMAALQERTVQKGLEEEGVVTDGVAEVAFKAVQALVLLGCLDGEFLRSIFPQPREKPRDEALRPEGGAISHRSTS